MTRILLFSVAVVLVLATSAKAISFICENGGSCTASADAPYCLCAPGFFGDKCQFIRDPCYNFGCQNGGSCTAPADWPYCLCPDGYSGDKCQTKSTPSTGSCPPATGFGICGGIFCSVDSDCSSNQKCCKSACGGYLCTNVN